MGLFKITQDGSLQRYDFTKFVKKLGNNWWDILDSEFISRLRSITQFSYMNVLTEVGRPDLLSETCYGSGNTQYWWILMLINGLTLPEDITIGMQIKFPSIDKLEDIYFTLIPSSDQTTTTTAIESLS